MKIHFLVNPRSGRAGAALGEVQAFAHQHGARLTLTERSRHASELARRALDDGADLIVAVGGDGTMNEVAAALVGTNAIFGLIPCGSGDGLGRHLGIHGSVRRALDLLVTGQPRKIDTGLANGQPFFAVAGLGFEAEIAARFNRLTQRGFFRYLTTSARAWRQFVPLSASITPDTDSETRDFFTLAVANTDQYGNNARIAPGASVEDGLLDLTCVPRVGAINALPLLIRLFSGTLVAPAVWRRQSSRFTVSGLAPGLFFHTDGETHPAGSSVEFSIRPSSLRVMAPPRS